jgi:hypothetical protein
VSLSVILASLVLGRVVEGWRAAGIGWKGRLQPVEGGGGALLVIWGVII